MERLRSRELKPLETVRQALAEHPASGYLLELAAYASLVEEQPELSLRYLKKLNRHFFLLQSSHVAHAIALAQQGRWSLAQSVLEKNYIRPAQVHYFLPPGLDGRWWKDWVTRIARWRPESERRIRTGNRATRASHAGAGAAPPVSASASPQIAPPLPRLQPRIAVRVNLPEPAAYELLDRSEPGSFDDFLMRRDVAHLALLGTFTELLCLGQLRGVDHYEYQIETVRKVLKQFRGRVLLADEVGLGKTVEAGMVAKEYLLRGMARRVLVLTPASLVSQWREEMSGKFGLEFSSTQDPDLQRDPASFWTRPLLVASIAAARREPHFDFLTAQEFDLVIVDEAHHLKNRASKNWKLVDALRKRFLLLLSATPVENDLMELYNILTLLKPGIFKTEKEFRALFVAPDNPRLPANCDRLRELMRDAMIRNTRALVQVRLPPRTAATVLVDASDEEAACYGDLSRLIRELPVAFRSGRRTSVHRLLEAAGSSPRAAAAGLERFLEHDPTGTWKALWQRYSALGTGSKADVLLELLARNPEEKKIVFVRFRETLRLVEELLERRGIRHAVFEGALSGAEKDAAVGRFRDAVPVLVSTEAGGEGRNLQFANTLVNFDLPWNPFLIEQRIGRIHRIGQTREVFVFNLAARGTVEDQILRILGEKIQMFELVVGEIQAILGDMEEDEEFSSRVFSAWIEATEEDRRRAFQDLEARLLEARAGYDEIKRLDDELFGQDFEAL